AGRAPRQRLHDLAAGIDDGADAGRRRADDRNAFLGGAEPGLGEMLGRAPAAEPGVVRRIEDEVRPVAAVGDLAGENDLVAELEADLAPAGDLDGARAGAGDEVDVARRE